MAMDAVPFDLLRSSLDELKLRFRAANDPGSPSKAWLLHIPDKGRSPILMVRLDGYQDYRYLRLKPIIEDAVRLSDKLPAAVQTRLWGGPTPETPVGLSSDPTPQWMMAVFELLNASGVGPPLRRVRDLPLDEKPVGFKFPPAAEWYATLPDFAAASVQAVAIIQSWLPDVPQQEAEGDGVARILAAIAQQQQTPKLKRGGQRKYDPKLKKRIRDAWATGRHKRYSDCDTALKLEPGTTKRVLDTARK